MSDDELDLLSLLLKRHGVKAVTAALALVCTKRATEAAVENDSDAAGDWSYNADLLSSLSGLVSEPALAPK